MQAWGAWFGTLGDSVADMGNPFGNSATVSSGGVADGGKSGAGGYSIVSAGSLSDATAKAKGCPVLAGGGSVEVYEAIPMEWHWPGPRAGPGRRGGAFCAAGWSCCLARGNPDTSRADCRPLLRGSRRVTRLAAGLAQERRYPAIRRDRSCRDWIGLRCTRG